MLEEFLVLYNAKLIEKKESYPKKSEGVKDLFRYYKLSIAGDEFRKEQKALPKIIKAITPILAAATEGAIRALPIGK